MTIALIYHHEERHLAEKCAEILHREGYEATLAPVDCPMGSQKWQDQLCQDFEAASGFIVLITAKIMNSGGEWFIWRLNQAYNTRPAFMYPKPIYTIFIPPEELVKAGIDSWRTFASSISAWFYSIDDAIEATDIYKNHLRAIANLQLVTLILHNVEDKINNAISAGQDIDVAATTIRESMRFITGDMPHCIPYCFLSYSRTNAEFASRLVADLRKCGFKIWIDRDSIRVGITWDTEIEKALTECTHLLLVATPQSIASQNVIDEVNFAINKNKLVIPLMVEKCELPLRMHRFQWIDFQQDYETAFRRLHQELMTWAESQSSTRT
ncbi:MAG: toll/interleukin-1 receptor domain-containing protein [Anaerolineae bacterium]|nr:toll/interleukin-1 receptor domain-containing protein [Anaerolineae bacterium]